jgi:hypothetical protein
MPASASSTLSFCFARLLRFWTAAAVIEMLFDISLAVRL